MEQVHHSFFNNPFLAVYNLLSPPLYICKGTKDLIKNRSNIHTKENILFPHPRYDGTAIILFESTLRGIQQGGLIKLCDYSKEEIFAELDWLPEKKHVTKNPSGTVDDLFNNVKIAYDPLAGFFRLIDYTLEKDDEPFEGKFRYLPPFHGLMGCLQ